MSCGAGGTTMRKRKPGGGQTPRFSQRPQVRMARYLLALAVIVAGIYLTANPRFRVCELVTKDVGLATQRATQTCSAPVLTQASVLAFAALVVALLWPDIQEFTIFGVSIKKLTEAVKDVAQAVDRVDTSTSQLSEATGRIDDATRATADRAERIVDDTRGIRETTTNISQNLSSTKAGVASVQATLASHATRLTEILERLQGLDGRLDDAGTARGDLAWNDNRDPDAFRELVIGHVGGPDGYIEYLGKPPTGNGPARAVMIGQLLISWQRLGGLSGAGVDMNTDRRGGPLSAARLSFALRSLERIIDALARGDVVNTGTLRDALILARSLLGD